MCDLSIVPKSKPVAFARPFLFSTRKAIWYFAFDKVYLIIRPMSDWSLDEHKTAGGQSHFVEFVASLADSKDVKDAAVLTGALRALGNQLREPRSKALDGGYSSCAAPGCEYITGSCRDDAPCWLAAT
jgi:hypothetical protein